MGATSGHRDDRESPAEGGPSRHGGVPSRLERWERASQIPLIAASLAFLAAFAAVVLAPGMPRPWTAVCRGILLCTWALFATDVALRLVFSPDRRAFLRGDWLALVILAVPTLCPLRAVGMIGKASIRHRRSRLGFQAQVAAYAGLTTLLFGLTASLGVLQAERGAPRATITTFGDAVWWTVSTITTVGYGDAYPVTGKGRWIGGALMLGGIGLLGVVTASFASWFTTRFRDLGAPGPAGAAREGERVSGATPPQPPYGGPEELEALRRAVERLRADDTGGARPPEHRGPAP